jgi:phosphotransferase system enzyme I (PtsI)
MAASQNSSEVRYKATAVSRGIGIGRVAFPNDTAGSPTSNSQLYPAQIDAEIGRLLAAVEQTKSDLADLSSSDPTGIFGVQLLILEDTFIDDVEALIRKEGIVSERSLRSVSAGLVNSQRSVPDSYISEKYIDIQDVTDRLLRALAPNAESDQMPTGMIYVVEDLTPSGLLELAKTHPKGLISSHGGWTSHTSILGRELRLPIVSGFQRAHSQLNAGDVVIVDAVDGQIVVNPTRQTLREFRVRRKALPNEMEYGSLGNQSHMTMDGRAIVIRVNASTREAYERGKRSGASGIGLYRSEGILAGRRSLPSEDEQFEAYSEIGRIVGNEGVRIRTFDIGTERMPGNEISQTNPALGLRAIRLGLTDESIFRTQIRAILRAASDPRLDIVLPMVSGTGDVLRLKEIIKQERGSLQSAAVPVGDPAIGVMIEVPSAVMTAAAIARHVDFLCLGTNDLVQYLLAVDRDNPSVAEWYQTLHPAVLRSILEIIGAGETANIPVEICGEMAGSPFYVPLLLGLGAVELSMNSNSVDAVRRLIGQIDMTLCIELVRLTDGCETADEVSSVLRVFYRKHWPELFSPELLADPQPTNI